MHSTDAGNRQATSTRTRMTHPCTSISISLSQTTIFFSFFLIFCLQWNIVADQANLIKRQSPLRCRFYLLGGRAEEYLRPKLSTTYEQKTAGQIDQPFCYFSCLLHKVVIHQQRYFLKLSYRLRFWWCWFFKWTRWSAPRFVPTIFGKVHSIRPPS